MNIKVIIQDGIVTEVLADGAADVEVIDIDRDYEDYEALIQYAEKVRQNPMLVSQAYTVAGFEK